MNKILRFVLLAALIWGTSGTSTAQGVYIGAQVGTSSQKPNLRDIDFSRSTSYLYGANLGVKVFMLSVELNYFQTSHDLDVADAPGFEWADREIKTSYQGLNFRFFFPVLMLHPYLTVGYGNYKATISRIGEDTDRGFNVGAGLEVQLGRRFSLRAEGKYHNVDLNIDDRELELGDFTLTGGFSFYF